MADPGFACDFPIDVDTFGTPEGNTLRVTGTTDRAYAAARAPGERVAEHVLLADRDDGGVVGELRRQP